MVFKSIRFTLTLWYAVTLAIILVLFCMFIFVSLRKDLSKEIDQELLAVAEAVASPTLEPFRDAGHSVFDQVLEDFIGPKITGKYVQILDRSGQVRTHTRNMPGSVLPLSSNARHRAEHGEISFESATTMDVHPTRIIVYPIMQDGRLEQMVEIGASMKTVAETLDKVLLVFAISIPVSLLLWTFGGWFLAGRALKPVDLITRSVKEITASNLSQRLAVVNPRDEIGQLASTFNSTLARLESSFNRVSQFTADVSHELRTPLTILRGEAEVGLKWAKEPDEFRELLNSNLDEIKRMSEIIEKLLEISRAEEGGMYLEMQDVDLHDMLSEIILQTRLIAQDKQIKVSMEGGAPVHVKGDWIRLRQVFMNIIDNAVNYTPADGNITVEIGVNSGSEARVSIIDSGPGIPPEALPHIFDRFFRIDKARNRAHGGVGLGLSLAKTYIEAHGGRIEVVSEPGKGSVFTVFLPTTRPERHD